MRATRAPIALAIVAAISVAACAGSPVGSSPQAQTSALAPEATPDSPGPCGSATISIDYEQPLTTEKMVGNRWNFAVVDVEGVKAPVFNTTDGKAPPGPPKDWPTETMIYTPIDVNVDQAFGNLGKTGPGQFLVEGGTVGCYTYFVTPVPEVEVGKRYVFISGDARDAAGNAVLPVPRARFAWAVDSSGMVETIDGRKSVDRLRDEVVELLQDLPRPTGLPVP